MLIKYLDYISPPITFYYHGSLSHTSIISGFISIISLAIIIILWIYFLLGLIQRKDPNAFYFNSFVEDAGIYPLNASSLFHFITIATISNGLLNNGIDFTNFRIVGYETFFETYFNDKNLNNYDHWLYGKCNNDSDTQGIGYLINYEFFEKSACIKKYFIFADQKYYDTGDEKFRWPKIAHGTYNEKLKLYSIFIEKCQEDTINLILGDGHHCKSDLEIDESFKKVRIANFYFINNYINVLDYENPNTKFFYKIETGIYQNQYTINHLNFNPSKIKTHNGLILDNIKEEESYLYDRNDALIEDNNGNNVYIGYCLWLKNTMNYYERTYKRIQDIISSIGGINQVITMIAIYINSLFNHYIVLTDTEKLLHFSIHEEKKIQKNNIKYDKSKNVIKEKEIEKEKQRKNSGISMNNEKSNIKIKNHSIEVDKSKTSNKYLNKIEKSNSFINKENKSTSNFDDNIKNKKQNI